MILGYTFDVGETINVLLNGYSYRANILNIVDDKYLVYVFDKDMKIEVLKTQTFSCSYYWRE